MTVKNLNHLKIIRAVALKDITQAIKDKMVLGVIIGVFLLIIPSQLVPFFLQNETIPLGVIYGTEPTTLSNALSDLPDTSSFSVKSLPALRDSIVSGRSNTIGLVLPQDYANLVSTEEKITFEAYLPHWTEHDEAVQLVQHFEDEISMLTGNPVEIIIVDNQVYPDEDTRGSEMMFVLQMINAIMTFSLVLVPQLMMTEKETHTLDALLVSPANLTDLVIAKGIVGVFYAAIASLIIILMNLKIIAHWPLLIMSVISGIVFAVLTGLFIGLLFDNFQQATLLMWLVVIIAIAPAFINLVLTVNLPKILEDIMYWLPSGQMANLLLMSLMQSVENQTVILGLGAMCIVNLILFGLTLWQIKRQMK